jgi:hypothetical protein
MGTLGVSIPPHHPCRPRRPPCRPPEGRRGRAWTSTTNCCNRPTTRRPTTTRSITIAVLGRVAVAVAVAAAGGDMGFRRRHRRERGLETTTTPATLARKRPTAGGETGRVTIVIPLIAHESPQRTQAGPRRTPSRSTQTRPAW